MRRNRLSVIMTPATAWTLFVALVSMLGAIFLTPAWAVENGPIENTQVVILLLGGLIAGRAYYKGHGSLARKRLYLLSIPAWLLMAGRELSWGRVFYPMGGGHFIPLKQLPYGQFVYPVIGAILIGMLYYMIANQLHREIIAWVRQGNFPIIDIALLICTIFMADAFEHHSHGFFMQQEELYEELSELVAYTAMVTTFVNLSFDHHYDWQASPTQSTKLSKPFTR